ncbi:AGE family epimerase/isomerase [Pseudoduganella violaceinigra]|uniref:AGE family epimerase/isomerase n=1 Tax=Pseudoduganella violaceinigra TaxID=246602 RepID=UPI0003F8B927|nr:AGE family epimerase/isomerase [Pseudoduganella violaceinigra]
MRRRAAIAACLALLAACDSGGGGRAMSKVANTEWHRKDLDAHLSRWLAVAPTPSGMLRGQFDRNWQPADSSAVELTLHSRLVYTMLVGYEATHDPRYLEAAKRGADFLLGPFHDTLNGGFYQVVDATGKVVSPAKNTYGHAFALLALAHAARVTGEATYRDAALAAWQDIRLKLREPGGGLRGAAARDFAPAMEKRHSQNPLMHMFEALLALIDATGDQQVVADARALGDFVLNQLMVGLPDGGTYIPEWYDAQWKPLRDDDGFTDLGHQFEWSHLLRSAELRGLPPTYAAVADRLLKFAVAHGYDEQDGGIFNRMSPGGQVDHGKFWWQQAEGMKAFLAVAERPDMARRYQETLELVDREIIDRDNGGWRFGAKQTCSGGGCSKQQPDPYHMVGLDWTVVSAKP